MDEKKEAEEKEALLELLEYGTLEIDHATMVRSLAKKPEDIMKNFTLEKLNLMHAKVGIAKEAGELLDELNRVIVYDKPLDRDNVIEELGDIEFYMAQLRAMLNITREETLKQNMSKLAERYKNFKYSNEQALARADKNPAPSDQAVSDVASAWEERNQGLKSIE